VLIVAGLASAKAEEKKTDIQMAGKLKEIPAFENLLE